MPRNCWTRCNKTFPCSFPAREKTREIESRETSKRLEKQAILALLRKMIYKLEFVGGHPDEYCIFLKNLTETELSQITSLDGAPLDVKEERNDIE